MPYYHRDADFVAHLEEEIGSVGMPMVVTRKFNGIVNAVVMQIEEEYANPQVVDTLFDALLQLASTLREPERSTISKAVERCREGTAKRLLKRGDLTGAST